MALVGGAVRSARRSSAGWWLGLAAGAGTVVASIAGISTDVYRQEAPSWAAQGIGQDTANLLVAVPGLLWAAYAQAKGSVRARLVWIGLLLYLTYSYLLYSLFVHFQAWFVLYVATLGLSFYAMVLSVASLDEQQAYRDLGIRRRRGLGAYLIASGTVFVALWLLEIVPAAFQGTSPSSAAEVGFPVNPVHVLDLAFILPAVIAAGVLNWRGHRWGLLLGVPLLTFSVVMGAAILMMMESMYARSLPFAWPPVVAMSVVVVFGAGMLARVLAQPCPVPAQATQQAPTR